MTTRQLVDFLPSSFYQSRQGVDGSKVCQQYCDWVLFLPVNFSCYEGSEYYFGRSYVFSFILRGRWDLWRAGLVEPLTELTLGFVLEEAVVLLECQSVKRLALSTLRTPTTTRRRCRLLPLLPAPPLKHPSSGGGAADSNEKEG